MKHYATLSEAIREGAKLRPQGTGGYGGLTSCALEAAAEAIGGELEWGDENRFLQLYPYCFNRVTPPMEGDLWTDDAGTESLFSLCWQLNDRGWTREQIADWLEGEEEKLGYVTVVEDEISEEREVTSGSRLEHSATIAQTA